MTYSAGTPLVHSLKWIAGVMSNRVFSEAVLAISEDVATGQPLHLAIQRAKIFPNKMVQLIAIGEESGNIEQMLTHITRFYEDELNTLMDRFSSLLEPCVMIILGLLIGGLVIGMYLPIFELGSIL
jgi:type IV pilus assembly protein PilC